MSGQRVRRGARGPGVVGSLFRIPTGRGRAEGLGRERVLRRLAGTFRAAF